MPPRPSLSTIRYLPTVVPSMTRLELALLELNRGDSNVRVNLTRVNPE
jgi:hypothetical protein